MRNSSFLHKLYQAICKDTGGQNESVKLIVVVRLLTLMMLIYSSVSIVLCLFAPHTGGISFSLLSTILFLSVFIISYHTRTFSAFCILNGCILMWIIFSIYLFGWDTGVQHFIITLLIFSFFSKYRHAASKLVYAAALCALRLCLYYYCKTNAPVVNLTPRIADAFQIVNTLAIFSSIAMLSYLFSADAQKMEGKLIEYNEQLRKQASIDPLTGLYNRRRTTEYLDDLLRAPDSQISICICDIDFFKRVNDTYGHDVGDTVLKKLAETFQEELPDDTFVSRWGGEEFLLIFPSMNGDEAAAALDVLRHKIKELVFDGGIGTFSISLTFGLEEYDFHSNLDSVLKNADEKLYYGKKHGRDQIVF